MDEIKVIACKSEEPLGFGPDLNYVFTLGPRLLVKGVLVYKGRSDDGLELFVGEPLPLGDYVIYMGAREQYPVKVLEHRDLATIDKTLYFIQDTRQFVGNAMVFWRPKSSGYTCNIDEAGQFSRLKADSICKSNSNTIMWPMNEIQKKAIRIADMQYFTKLSKEESFEHRMPLTHENE